MELFSVIGNAADEVEGKKGRTVVEMKPRANFRSCSTCFLRITHPLSAENHLAFLGSRPQRAERLLDRNRRRETMNSPRLVRMTGI